MKVNGGIYSCWHVAGPPPRRIQHHLEHCQQHSKLSQVLNEWDMNTWLLLHPLPFPLPCLTTCQGQVKARSANLTPSSVPTPMDSVHSYSFTSHGKQLVIFMHSMLEIRHVFGLMDKDSFFHLRRFFSFQILSSRFFSFLLILQYSVSLSFLMKEICKNKNKVGHQCKV